jgi:hypothetical protein
MCWMAVAARKSREERMNFSSDEIAYALTLGA